MKVHSHYNKDIEALEKQDIKALECGKRKRDGKVTVTKIINDAKK